MKEKEYNIKFKKVSENEIVVSAKNKKEAMEKARELFNSDLKDIDINNITKYYYVIEINNKEIGIITFFILLFDLRSGCR